MAHHTRAQSSISGGAPHALSLKVLRLSRPALATQTTLPPTSFDNGLDIPASASLAFPAGNKNVDGKIEAGSSFPLTPLLTLPAAFGAAYVGETFRCTLCVNCEVGGGEEDRRSVSGVRVHAELQTPAEQQGLPLQLRGAGHEDEDEGEGEDDAMDIEPSKTIQFTLAHDLKEEGPHVLAVTVSYTETLHGPSGASGGRARTFRKLYQFVAQPLIAVRSKVTELKRRAKPEERRWVLEAQLENVGETAVVLEKLWLKEREGVVGKSLNGDGGAAESKESVVLKPQDVEQVMFLLREERAESAGLGRVPLAQVNIDWRSAMGEKGSLTTGWLASRPR